MRTLALELPWPPSGNASVRHFIDKKSGKLTHLRSENYRKYRQLVYKECLAAGAFPRPVFTASVRVTIHATPPDKRKRDIHDNLPKTLCDSLTFAGVFEDDSQIDDIRVRRVKAKPGTVLVFIEELNP